ncbi:MAG: TonB family protein [Bacteroidota bacterium]
MKYVVLVIFSVVFIGTGTSYAQTRKNSLAPNTNPQTFTYVEQMPVFPGNQNALSNYLRENIKYPEDAVANNIQGKVIVKFVVNDSGNIRNATIVLSVFPSLDSEALRVVNNMPAWKPGHQQGKPVSVYFTLPISFKLEENNTDTIPQFNGNLRLYIQETMNYPAEAKKNHIQGLVKVKVLIDENGKIHDPKIVKSAAPLLDA